MGTYHCYITNLSNERFTPDQVAALYRVRWEVELLFRELKTRYELDAIQTSKAAIVEVLDQVNEGLGGNFAVFGVCRAGVGVPSTKEVFGLVEEDHKRPEAVGFVEQSR